ncbi:hypothetical protein CPI05_08750 [Moraxella catarrhalis]|nr:hypothetical protein [Moraxella catarrhalis]MPW93924.1 hypothetical protein [Moraxella catarrhalis]MPX34495.1 hypothetical protein [Moraxella catarrhalis]RKL73404.1 hypothetical protein D6D66_08595 [Moraxella catarrhalis]
MIVKSRQDTYQYTHDQKQAGFSADVGFDGKPQSFSINGGKTDVDDPNTLTDKQKEAVINQAKLIAGITAAFAGEDVNVAAGVAAEAVENNTFAEMYPNEWDEIVNNTDGSYSLELHEAISRNKQYILIGTSFIPVVGDIQGFVEAQTAGDYVFAVIGIIPLGGDALQKANQAKKAYENAKAAQNTAGMKNATQEGVTILKQNQGKAGTPVVSQPISGVQAQRQIRSGQANIAGYTIDKNGRLHNNRGQFTSDPNNPRVSTNLIRPNLRAELRRQVDANYIRLPNGDYVHRDGTVVRTPVQYGHTYGREHRRLVLAAEQTGLTQTQFNDFINSRPDYFRLENASDNMGHRNEKPGSDDLGEIIRHMNQFKRKRGIR